MGFVNWLAGIIAKAVADKAIELYKEERETISKVGAIGVTAKEHLEEYENAQSEAERIAVLRKIANFASLSKLVL